MDDLVGRLRDIARHRAKTNEPSGSSPEIMTEWIAADEIERLRHAIGWLLYRTSGRELRRIVGELSDTSNLNEFISAIERARSTPEDAMPGKATHAYNNGFAACTIGGEPITDNPFHPREEAKQWSDWREGWNDARTAELPVSKRPNLHNPVPPKPQSPPTRDSEGETPLPSQPDCA